MPAPRPQSPPAWPADPLPEAFEGFGAPGDAVQALWPAGEAAAAERLEAFADGVIDVYQEQRDFPCLPATSCLSPYLAAGVLSPGLGRRSSTIGEDPSGFALILLVGLACDTTVVAVASRATSTPAANRAAVLAMAIGVMAGLGSVVRRRSRSRARRPSIDVLGSLIALLCVMVSAAAVLTVTANSGP